jgi:hypothetical protein
MSGACVQGVPNGSHVHLNGLVTVPDGSTYLSLPCAVGTYRMTLTQRLAYADGTEWTTELTLSTGTYSWRRDSLTLVDRRARHQRRGQARALDSNAVSLSGATVTVVTQGHEYRFVAVPRPR